MNIAELFDKEFVDDNGEEYGLLRAVDGDPPEEIVDCKLIAEDSCGNYFILDKGQVVFWDHETSERTVLAPTFQEFASRCSTPEDIQVDDNDVLSVWVDPELSRTRQRVRLA